MQNVQSHRYSLNLLAGLTLAVFLVLCGLTGCQNHQALHNPQDQPTSDTTGLAPQIAPAQTTEPASSATPTVPPTPRPWSESENCYQNVSMQHPPLYLEDPFESAGSNDGQFQTWAGDDALSLVASPAIFLVNVVAMPVTAVAEPPWKPQYSRDDMPVQEPTHVFPAPRASEKRDEPVFTQVTRPVAQTTQKSLEGSGQILSATGKFFSDTTHTIIKAVGSLFAPKQPTEPPTE